MPKELDFCRQRFHIVKGQLEDPGTTMDREDRLRLEREHRLQRIAQTCWVERRYRWLSASSLEQVASADVMLAIAVFLDNAEPERVEQARPETERLLGLIADTAEDDEVRELAEGLLGQ